MKNVERWTYLKRRITVRFQLNLRFSCRLEFLVDSCVDDISEYINIGDSTVNHIFKLLLLGCVELLYNKYVYISFGEELDKVKLVYQKLGLPGCIGSMNCTHILWHRCPKKLNQPLLFKWLLTIHGKSCMYRSGFMVHRMTNK